MNARAWIFIGMVVAAFAMQAEASLVVDFDGPTTNSVARDADSRTAREEWIWDFSDSTAMFTSSGGQNTTIYGGLSINCDSGSGPVDPGIRLDGGTAAILNYLGTSTNPVMKGTYIWKQADYLAGSSQGVEFDESSSLSISVSGYTLPNNSEMRFVAQQGGTYYVSQFDFSGSGTYSLSNPNTNTWAVLDTSDYTYGAMNAVTFTNVEAVGFYFSGERTVSPGIIRIDVDDFQVNATVIPEPATFGMIGTGIGLALMIRRRRR
jgi:hypothetical protein